MRIQVGAKTAGLRPESPQNRRFEGSTGVQRARLEAPQALREPDFGTQKSRTPPRARSAAPGSLTEPHLRVQRVPESQIRGSESLAEARFERPDASKNSALRPLTASRGLSGGRQEAPRAQCLQAPVAMLQKVLKCR